MDKKSLNYFVLHHVPALKSMGIAHVHFASFAMVASCFVIPQISMAQSMGSFETVPYIVATPETKITPETNVIFVPDKELNASKPVTKPVLQPVSKPIVKTDNKNITAKKPVVKSNVKTTIATTTAEVPLPVIMFCGTPANGADAGANIASASKDTSKITMPALPPVMEIKTANSQNTSQNPNLGMVDNKATKEQSTPNPYIGPIQKTKTFKEDWDNLNRRPDTREEYANRGPVTAIYQDTKQAIAKDVPQAIADHLPWVDTNRKQENFDSVLDRVADNLSRASAADPEWAYAAQNEIRELAQKLDKLPQPPQYRDETIYRDYSPKDTKNEIQDVKQQRPVWPGAKSSSAEPENKPYSLKNN